jgi:hypothetical protein
MESTEDLSGSGEIDSLNNLKDDKIYIFSGKSDSTVITKVVDKTNEFYLQAGVSAKNILYNKTIDAGHAFITINSDDTPCSQTMSPYINYCDYDQAGIILKQIYGTLNPPAASLSGKFIEFSQDEFFDYGDVSMGSTGFVYVPKSFEDNTCRIHVVFHGCLQSVSAIGDLVYKTTGYNRWADTNNIIVLYPQIKKSVMGGNPNGCWDFWGYTKDNFYTKNAPQMKTVMNMIERLAENK